MKIGRQDNPFTAISTADAASLTVRGRDLCGDLMGRLSFTEYFFLLVTGHEPDANQRYFLDLLLVAIAEHGLVPSVQAARMTLAAAPDALQGAVAAGILGAGPVILGASETSGAFLTEALEKTGGDPFRLETWLEEIRAEGRRVPGFGHPLHKPLDPRAERILALSREKGAEGPHQFIARQLVPLVPQVWGKVLPMNVSMAIAAVLLDLGFPRTMLRAIPILGRTASLLAHLGEEQIRPIGFVLSAAGEDAVGYDGGA